jgi:ribosomal protein L11 methyltransferase
MTIPELWRIALTVPENLVAFFADAVGDHAVSVSTFEIEEGVTWLVEAISHGEPDRSWLTARIAVLAEAMDIPAPEMTIEPVPQLDWLTRSYKSFPPIRAGRFFVHGSHHEGGVPPSSIGLLVDAATAFGSGEHATTYGCLVALDQLARRVPVRRALDMGCGSGILALAIAKLWHVPVVASDIDAESVRVTHLNARRNRVSALVRAVGGKGYAVEAVRRGRPYDLIASNILARPLARMAPDLRRALRPGGHVVLSGLLDRHENWVLAAHRAQGLRLVGRIPVGEWRTLILRG